MPDKFDRPISLLVDADAEPIRFETASELSEWLKTERDKLVGWVREVERSLGPDAGVRIFLAQRFDAPQPLIAEFKNLETHKPARTQAKREEIEVLLRAVLGVGKGNPPTSGSRRGRRVQVLADDNREVAYAALAFFLNMDPVAEISEESRRVGTAHAIFLDLGYAQVALQQEALLRAECTAAVAAAQAERDRIIKEAEAKAEQIVARVTAAQEVKSAADHWHSQWLWHEVLGYIWLLVLGLVTWRVYGFLRDGLPRLLVDSADWQRSAVVTVLSVSLAFWVLRILARLMLSERHLAADARERIVLIWTYLRLRAGGEMEPSDRALALKAIFRPGHSLSDDEGGPVNPTQEAAAAIANQVGKGRS